jgi:multidrug efflux pump subunit AcrA (membrane-fusion protein)
MHSPTIRKVFLAAAALGGGFYLAMPYVRLSTTMATAAQPESPAKVDVVRVRRGTVARRLVSNATLEAFEEADLFAKVSGYLKDVRVDIGDHVKQGQVLATVDVPEMRNSPSPLRSWNRENVRWRPPTGKSSTTRRIWFSKK